MQPSLKKNYIYSVFYEILKLITPFITMPYVARVLEADGVGAYSFTNSNITYFMLLGALGTASYGAREIARNRDDRKKTSQLFWEIEIMTIITSGISLIAWVIFILLNSDYRWHYVALTPFILSTMFDISWFFTGLEKIKNIVIRNTVMKILGIILLFVLVKTKEDILIYCVINSGISLLGNLSMWTYLPGLLTKVHIQEFRFKRHFHETLIYFIPTIATSVYTVLDKTLIGAITGNSYQNGFYEEATKVINVAKAVVFSAVNSVMGARLSYLFAENKHDEIKRKILRSMDFILLIAFGATFGIIGISNVFVPVFLGDGYDPVIVLLYIMAPLVCIIGISNCLGSQYYTPSGQRKRSAKVIVLGAVVNLCLNLLLIPWLGAYGATIASVIAECLITVFYIKMCDGYITMHHLWEFTRKRVPAGIVMCIIVFITGEFLRPLCMTTGNSSFTLVGFFVLVMQMIAGFIAYVIILLILKDYMLKEMIAMLKKTVLRIRKKLSND